MEMRKNIGMMLAGVLAAVALAGCDKKEAAPAEPTPEVLLERVEGIDRLTLAQMRITKMATIDDIKLDEAEGARQVTAAIIDALKIGDRKAAYSYDTYLTAYVDLDELRPGDITVDTAAKRIGITLPRPRTQYSGRDSQIREDHYRVTGLRSAISAEERAALKEKMNAHLKKEVSENTEFSRMLTDNARRRGESFFKELLSEQGYEVEVNWR